MWCRMDRRSGRENEREVGNRESGYSHAVAASSSSGLGSALEDTGRETSSGGGGSGAAARSAGLGMDASDGGSEGEGERGELHCGIRVEMRT